MNQPAQILVLRDERRVLIGESVVTICRLVMIVLRICICESVGPLGSGIRPQCGKTFFELNVTDPKIHLACNRLDIEVLSPPTRYSQRLQVNGEEVDSIAKILKPKHLC